jgi:hypothetical protein
VRNWAYSFDLVGRGKREYEATALYHNHNGRWKVSNHRGPCLKHAVPKKIYQPACETNWRPALGGAVLLDCVR